MRMRPVHEISESSCKYILVLIVIDVSIKLIVHLRVPQSIFLGAPSFVVLITINHGLVDIRRICTELLIGFTKNFDHRRFVAKKGTESFARDENRERERERERERRRGIMASVRFDSDPQRFVKKGISLLMKNYEN